MTLLEDLRTGTDRLGRLLLELELDGDRRLLDAVPLTGATAARWSAVALLAAWEAHAELTETLERAGELRGSRRRAELERLLEGQPERLRAALEIAEEAAAIVRDAGAAWAALTPRLAAIAGPDAPQPRYDGLSAQLAADPLAVDPAEVEALEQAVAELAGLREDAATHVAEARALLDRVEAAQRDAEAAHELVLAKIANPSVPSPRRALSGLSDRLREAESLVEQARWADARDVLASSTGDATAELEQALAIAAANRAPLERRKLLRGLLKAYQGKARARRALEDDEVVALFEDAQHALYTAPTDLGAATELITRYQEALR